MSSADTSVESAVGAAVAMLEDVERAIASAPDCAGRAKMLAAWHAANGERLATVRSAMRAHAPNTLRPEVERQMKANPTVTKLFATAQSCMTDADFADAWEAVAKVMD